MAFADSTESQPAKGSPQSMCYCWGELTPFPTSQPSLFDNIKVETQLQTC